MGKLTREHIYIEVLFFRLPCFVCCCLIRVGLDPLLSPQAPPSAHLTGVLIGGGLRGPGGTGVQALWEQQRKERSVSAIYSGVTASSGPLRAAWSRITVTAESLSCRPR